MTRYAMILSAEDYVEFPIINYCHNDSCLIYEALTCYCDYDDENVSLVHLCKNYDEHKPTPIFEVIEEMLKKMEEEDTILFYYAGHGILHEGESYLVLPETRHCDITNTALRLSSLGDLFRRYSAKNFRILDACQETAI